MRLLKTAPVLLLASFALAHASDHTADTTKSGMSIFYDETTDDFSVGYDKVTNDTEFGVNFSLDSNKDVSTGDYTEIYVGLLAGMRKEMKGNTNLSYGVLGNYGFYSDDSNAASSWATKNPFTIGAYLGLGYNPNPNIEIFARVMPLSYERNSANQKEIEMFQEGHVGIRYFF